jgi:hypothetical protein
MRNGKGYLQPDKAGNFGYELVNLYKITGDKKYLEAAVHIGNTLLSKAVPGDNDHSPLPFRVNAKTGTPGYFFDNNFFGKTVTEAICTSNWTGTLLLFIELQRFDPGMAESYKKAFSTILNWMKTYPLKTNKWGPFFEDIPGWSDTQTNAITFASFILNHREFFADWKNDVKGIVDWTNRELGNDEYKEYKVSVMNEQTVYRVPGNSHSSRQASVELLYTLLTGDTAYKTNAIRTLNWATYTVADDGRNRYIRDDIWLTDGYGDYVRHYLRAMAAMPELAPANKNRLLGSSSVITKITGQNGQIAYTTFDTEATEVLRLVTKPRKIRFNGSPCKETKSLSSKGWTWTPLEKGGILRIYHTGSNSILIEY